MSLLNKIIFGDIAGEVLSLQEFECLKVISENQGISTSSLAELTGFPLYKVMLIVKKLSKKKPLAGVQPLLVSSTGYTQKGDQYFLLTEEGEQLIRFFLSEPKSIH